MPKQRIFVFGGKTLVELQLNLDNYFSKSDLEIESISHSSTFHPTLNQVIFTVSVLVSGKSHDFDDLDGIAHAQANMQAEDLTDVAAEELPAKPKKAAKPKKSKKAK